MLVGSVQSLSPFETRWWFRRGLIQLEHLWVGDPMPAVCEMVRRVVVSAAIWALEQGRKRLWLLGDTPPRQGFAIQQALSKPPPPSCLPCRTLFDVIGLFLLRSGMISALIILSCR
jgi:hypothetical protein